MVMAKIATFAFGFFASLLANLVRCVPARFRIKNAGALGWTPYPKLPTSRDLSSLCGLARRL